MVMQHVLLHDTEESFIMRKITSSDKIHHVLMMYSVVLGERRLHYAIERSILSVMNSWFHFGERNQSIRTCSSTTITSTLLSQPYYSMFTKIQLQASIMNMYMKILYTQSIHPLRHVSILQFSQK